MHKFMKIFNRLLTSITASVSVTVLNILPVVAAPTVPIMPAVNPAVDDILEIDHPFSGGISIQELIQECEHVSHKSQELVQSSRQAEK